VAALVGVPGSWRTSYEGQAAIELELAADHSEADSYPFRLRSEGAGRVVETRQIIVGVVEDLLQKRDSAEIAGRFHRSLAEIVAATCDRLRAASGTKAVALSGGTFQNVLLLNQVVALLTEQGFAVYRHQHVPANDGGLALGQAVLANTQWMRKA
jgi:hydrogenase maturation protein HypF